MASLKQLKARINSVKSTRKITSAMKVVAAAKLRRAQHRAEAARPYAASIQRMVVNIRQSLAGQDGHPVLLSGTGRDQKHLVVVISSDRGLAGGFNANVNRKTISFIQGLLVQGKEPHIFIVGTKAYDTLTLQFKDFVVGHRRVVMGHRPEVALSDAIDIAGFITDRVAKGECDVCTLIFNRFINVMTQKPVELQLVPAFSPDYRESPNDNVVLPSLTSQVDYEFEPDEKTVLTDLLPKNIEVQVFAALLESFAGEQGARMTAMDNATRNSDKAVSRLTLTYNQSRQAAVTNDLIDIISGADAV